MSRPPVPHEQSLRVLVLLAAVTLDPGPLEGLAFSLQHRRERPPLGGPTVIQGKMLVSLRE